MLRSLGRGTIATLLFHQLSHLSVGEVAGVTCIPSSCPPLKERLLFSLLCRTSLSSEYPSSVVLNASSVSGHGTDE